MGIKVDDEAFLEEIEKLGTAITEFEPYAEDFIKNSANKLDEFNSDSTDKLQSALKNMTDTKAPDLLEKVKNYYNTLVEFTSAFQTVDEEIANKFLE